MGVDGNINVRLRKLRFKAGDANGIVAHARSMVNRIVLRCSLCPELVHLRVDEHLWIELRRVKHLYLDCCSWGYLPTRLLVEDCARRKINYSALG
jgi:hypothetical protein